MAYICLPATLAVQSTVQRPGMYRLITKETLARKVMQRQTETETITPGESFAFDDGQALSQWAVPHAQQWRSPDRFDTDRSWYRLVTIAGIPVTLKVMPAGTVFWSSSANLSTTDIYRCLTRLLIPIDLPREAWTRVPPDLLARFLTHTPLLHIASASLGEAVIKAVIRQVISAQHARRLTYRFVELYGPTCSYEGSIYTDFPSLEAVARMSPDDLRACGLGYKAPLLPRIAHDLLQMQIEERLDHISSTEAIALLQSVKGIGRWTACVAMCDLRGDWSVYPFEDLAVRTWAARLWPGISWPREERAFVLAWHEMQGAYVGHITCYLLAQAGFALQSEQPRLLACQ